MILSRVIGVLIVDDHPAMRAGIRAVVRAEPGLMPVGEADTIDAAAEQACSERCDVVLVDYRLGTHNGLHLCRRLKSAGDLPRVLVYSAYAETELWLPAKIAGADGVLSKSAMPETVTEAIKVVAAGGSLYPEVERERIIATAHRLDQADLPVMGMALEGTPIAEIARTLQVTERSVGERLYRMIDRLGSVATGPGARAGS